MRGYVADVIGAAALLAALIYLTTQVARLVRAIDRISDLPEYTAETRRMTLSNAEAIAQLTNDVRWLVAIEIKRGGQWPGSYG